MNRREFLALGGCVLLGGCADFAVRPPTPAQNLHFTGLEQPAPGEHFYITIFGAQGTPKLPRWTHTWATVVHTSTAQGPRCNEPFVQHTISWLPATLQVRVLPLRPQPGVNLGLQQTLAWAVSNGERITQWGPYECRPEVYLRFVTQKAFLDSGRIGYQCVDNIGESARTGDGCDCIHAVTDMDPVIRRSRDLFTRYGENASRYIVQNLRRRGLLVRPEVIHDRLNGPLGLDGYPIMHQVI
jgi:hypothetical protein